MNRAAGHQREPGARKAIKQYRERLRRDLREQQRELQERAGRQAIPPCDDGPPPRID